jgi:hypothetical protein
MARLVQDRCTMRSLIFPNPAVGGALAGLAVIFLMALPVRADSPQVGVFYFPGWYRPGGETFVIPYESQEKSDWSEWRGAIAKAAKPRPMAGFYDDSDPRLWDLYEEWMRDHGIDFLAFDWYYNAGQDYLARSLDDGFLGAEQARSVQFCLHWCNHGGYWWAKPMDQSPLALKEMIENVSKRYFSHSHYLKIDGRPVFMIYDVDILREHAGPGGVSGSLQSMRGAAKKNGFPDLFLVAVYSRTSAKNIERLKEEGFDAFTAYAYPGKRGPNVRWDSQAFPYSEVVETVIGNVHPFLARIGREKGIPYWPTAFSGWDDRPRAGLEKATVLTGNTPEEFGRMARSALQHVGAESPFVMIEAWNEWGEGANIEPSKEHGFGYLREVARAREMAFPSDPRRPTEEEIVSWSILTDAERRKAEANEQMPWPVKETFWNRSGQSREAPAIAMPLVIDFSEIGPVNAGQAELLELDEHGALYRTTGNDASLTLPPLEVPMHQVRRIVIEAEPVEVSASFHFELFWATALHPDFTGLNAFTVPFAETHSAEIPVNEVMTWEKSGTPLTHLRLDLGDRPGEIVRVKRILLLGE